MRKSRLKPVTALIGTAFVASLASASPGVPPASPFAAEELSQGYLLLADQLADAKDGEGKCGEGKCGEGACGEAEPDEAKG